MLDVGCGPGALTAELVKRLGAAASSLPSIHRSLSSPRWRSVIRASTYGVHAAEQLPFEDAEFDATLAQLVVLLMENPTAGVAEMVRVTRKGGVVAASVWDYAGGRGPISTLWEAARELDPDLVDESHLAGVREGHLAEMFDAAGLVAVEEATHSIRVEHSSFEDGGSRSRSASDLPEAMSPDSTPHNNGSSANAVARSSLPPHSC